MSGLPWHPSMSAPVPFDLAALFDPATLARAGGYVDRVEFARIGGHELAARVSRADGREYRVRITAPIRPGIAPSMDCTCPVGRRCKHAAAVLIHLAVYGGPDGQDAGLEPKLPPALAATLPVARNRLPADWRRWLAAARAGGKDDHGPPSELIGYELDLDGERPRMTATRRRIGKSGALGKARVCAWHELVSMTGSELSRVERLLGGLLSAAPVGGSRRDGHDGIELAGEAGEQALLWALESGKLFLRGGQPVPLSLASSYPLDLGWMVQADGSQRFGIRDAAPGQRVFLLEQLWCCNSDDATLAPVESGLSATDAARLLKAPPVRAEHTIDIRQALSGLPGMGARLPLPEGAPVESERVTPRFVARLTMRELPDPNAPRYLAHTRVERPVVEMYAEYRSQRTALDGGGGSVHGYSEGRLRAFERDPKAEQKVIDAMAAAFGESDGRPDPARPHMWLLSEASGGYLGPIADGVEQLREVLDAFDARIEFDPQFPFELLATPADVEVEVEDGSEWFSTSLGIEVDGERLDLVPFLLNAVESIAAHGGSLPEGEFRLFLRLDERRVIGVPGERLRPLLELLLQWAAPRERIGDDGSLRLRRFEAASLAGRGTDWHLSAGTRDLAERLSGFKGLPAATPPPSLVAELRDYQLHGLAWLQFLREYGFGGVLADDMGLGKTVQLLAHLLREQADGRLDRPSLVVAPTSVIYNWRNEAARFAPTLRVLLLHGPQRGGDFGQIAAHDLVLTSYALLSRDEGVLVAQPWHVVALDEAQAVKNAKARASKVARRLQARQRLCLTGTPVENHLGELWAQFDFLMPGLLGDERQFRRVFRTPIEKHGDSARQIALNRRIAPFLLRRTKDGVVRELPAKTEVVHNIELDGGQRDLYETMRSAMQDRVQEAMKQRGFAQSRIEILDALLKLRQACCDPRLVKLPGAAKAKSSAKLEALLSMLQELLDEGRRVLVFSQFTSMLDLIEIELEKRKLRWVRLSGESTNRGAVVERFQNGEVPLFLLSLKAGGVGLNLTAADTVIHYDPWWNPAAEDQATDRAYRIGQDKPVFVYKLIAKGTVEEKMLGMQARKRALAAALYDDSGAAAAAFDADDLAELFAPIG
jgi:hypothetical protein